MHEPKPYGLFAYGGELTEDDFAFIDQCCKRVSNLKSVSNLNALKYTRELPDGGMVIIQDAGGVFRAIAIKQQITEQQQQRLDGVARSKVPMLFSGVINTGFDRGDGVEVSLSKMTQRRLAQYKGALGPGKLKRLSSPYTPFLKSLLVPQYMQGKPIESTLTQYHRLKSTWYSGAMAEVVQIVSGFGRQDLDNMPDAPEERAQMDIPEKVRIEIENELGQETRLPGYNGVPHEEGSVQYQFLFNSTDIVAFDVSKSPWLVRVQSSGVWAMPLPLIPATTTQAFRTFIEDNGDHEIETILDRFGGIPSGESFPSGADFYRWVRSGVIIKVCDIGDFYSHSPYTTVCGWSCNSSGTQLINTCYDYVDNICYGYTYQISLHLGVAEKRGWIKQRTTEQLTVYERNKVSKYLNELFSALPKDTHQKSSIIYKIRKVEMSEILSRADNPGENDIGYWDNYECDPIAIHNGNCNISNEGPLYGGVCLKLPEPFFDGCINMDFTPRFDAKDASRVDTIVFAYYIENDLKVIKSFFDERKAIKEVEGNFSENMIVGNWEQVEYNGLTGLSGELYSTDFDHRQEIAPTEITTKIEGRDLGYGKPLASFVFYLWTDGVLTRRRYYSYRTQKYTVTGKVIIEAFLVPFYCRNAAIYVEQEVIPGASKFEQMQKFSIEDPHSYEFWTYDFIWHWSNGGLKKTGKPFPKDSRPVWAEIHNTHYSNPNSDFADNGDWIGGLPADITHLVHPHDGITLISYGGEEPPLQTYIENTTEPRIVKNAMHLSMASWPMKLHEDAHDDRFYTPSPDGYNNVFSVDACKVVFGNVNYGNISIENKMGKRYQFGHSTLANNQHAHTFIGVINE